MIVSLNELESLVMKAVRGAGLDWGLAEEAAATASWLARADLLQLGPLVARLGTTTPTSPLVMDGAMIHPSTTGTSLCPILTGAFIADHGGVCQTLELHDVRAPLWLSAVVARALPPECRLMTEWEGVRLVLDSGGPLGSPGGDPFSSNVAVEVTGFVSLAIEQPVQAPRVPPLRSAVGIRVDDVHWHTLEALQRHTYVPASDRSRLAGAGAGLLDDD